jgi:rhodanese-related sulfurtransferase
MASLDQLPKDKEIVIHCNTGILASMAQKGLQGKGYTSRYLDAVVQVSADGSYEITEK